MGKALITILIVVFLLCVSVAAMAASKPPKTLCLQIGALSEYIILSTKPTGNKVTLAGNNKIAFYLVQGEATFGLPLIGTGHLYDNTFHFSVSGSTIASTSHHNTYFFEGMWDVSLLTGSISWTVQPGQDAVQEFLNIPITQVDCSTLTITHE